MSGTFPYDGIPDAQVWKRSVSRVARGEVDPQAGARFSIDRATRISSAGSCFAQRIAEGLQASGYTYFVAETGPLWESREWLRERHYGAYSARYGDVYTTTQLAQLAQRATGRFEPSEPAWQRDGRFFDPFRPRIEPGGYASEAAMLEDRALHLASVRRMLSESDVFVFTLGLTESWTCTADGAVLPMCPGTGGYGAFDASRYAFCNLSVEETVAAFERFLEIAWEFNPALRVILTVSPVPLAATMEPRHVVASTTWSKAVLRVAAEELRRRHERVEYFASYEIVGMPFDGIDNFEADRRTVAPAAVERVMRSFFRAFAHSDDRETATLLAPQPPAEDAPDPCGDEYLDLVMEQRRAAQRSQAE